MSEKLDNADGPIEEPMDMPELSHREIALRNTFVKEYLVDYDQIGAAVRCGYHASYAKEMGVRFMGCPYVVQRISQIELQTPEEEDAVMRKRVISGLIREANYRGPGSSPSARVAALSKLAAIQGMDAPTRNKTELTGADGQPLNGGGIFVVPGIVTLEEWEAKAAQQQEDLVNGTTPQVAQVASA